MAYIDDGQIAICRPGEELEIINLNNEHQDVEVKEIGVDLDMLDKGGFPHFMLKEIFDQPRVLSDCMRGRLFPSVGVFQPTDDPSADYSDPNVLRKVVLSAVLNNRARLLSATRFIIVACGTSWHAGLIGKQMIEQYCKIPVEVDYASEFRYRDPVIYPSDVVIAISQSGETADTLAAIRLAKEHGACILVLSTL